MSKRQKRLPEGIRETRRARDAKRVEPLGGARPSKSRGAEKARDRARGRPQQSGGAGAQDDAAWRVAPGRCRSFPDEPGAVAGIPQGDDRSDPRAGALEDRRPPLAAVPVLLGRGSRHPLDEHRADVRGGPLHAGGEAVPANAAMPTFSRRSQAKAFAIVSGRFYPFELDENTLYELDHRDEAVIPEQYRISERIAS